MDFSKSPLYCISRKRDLNQLIRIKAHNTNNYNVQYKPYIEQRPKKRLIEAPKSELKSIQKRIKKYLDCLDYPDNVFSGIKSRSYIDNAYYHIESNYFFKMDLSKFFPNTNREKVYKFYSNKMKMKNDIAAIMCDLSTVDLTSIMTKDVEDFIKEKGIRHINHLPSGSPISSILSYLANIDMFNELEGLAKRNNCIVSYYVDDIIFSSKNKISKSIVKDAERIITKYGQIVNIQKSKSYITKDYKKITGCVIYNHELLIPNKTKYKISNFLKQDNYTQKEINSILGLINNAQMFDRSKYNDLKSKMINKNCHN